MAKFLCIPADGLYKAYHEHISQWMGHPIHDELVPADPERCPASNVEMRVYAYEGHISQCRRERNPSHPEGLCWQHAKMKRKPVEETDQCQP